MAEPLMIVRLLACTATNDRSTSPNPATTPASAQSKLEEGFTDRWDSPAPLIQGPSTGLSCGVKGLSCGVKACCVESSRRSRCLPKDSLLRGGRPGPKEPRAPPPRVQEQEA
jgi:hypothetical protein